MLKLEDDGLLGRAEPHQKAFDLQARISGAAVFAAHREHLHPRFYGERLTREHGGIGEPIRAPGLCPGLGAHVAADDGGCLAPRRDQRHDPATQHRHHELRICAAPRKE